MPFNCLSQGNFAANWPLSDSGLRGNPILLILVGLGNSSTRHERSQCYEQSRTWPALGAWQKRGSLLSLSPAVPGNCVAVNLLLLNNVWGSPCCPRQYRVGKRVAGMCASSNMWGHFAWATWYANLPGAAVLRNLIACAAKSGDHAATLAVLPQTLQLVFSGIMVRILGRQMSGRKLWVSIDVRSVGVEHRALREAEPRYRLSSSRSPCSGGSGAHLIWLFCHFCEPKITLGSVYSDSTWAHSLRC